VNCIIPKNSKITNKLLVIQAYILKFDILIIMIATFYRYKYCYLFAVFQYIIKYKFINLDGLFIFLIT
jgi:hypothetical protein